MFRWQTTLGAVIGLFVGLAVVTVMGSLTHREVSGPVISECDGRLRELVIQYEPSSREIVSTVYRSFLGQLDSDVTVHVVVPESSAYENLLSWLGPVRCRLAPIVTHHPITTWSRDRWVALTPTFSSGPTTLWSPRSEASDGIWPTRAGDEKVGQDIAAALAPSVRAIRSELFFDAGDFLADGDHVFVVPRLLGRNIQVTVANRAQFLTTISTVLKRQVIMLDESPDHHAGMFMASIGNHVMLVGDPSLGKPFCPSEQQTGSGTNAFMHLPDGPDFSPGTQHLFDAVASQCAAARYRVIRMPTMLGHDSRTYLTYLNVIQDREGDRRIVYLPTYQGVEAMNAAACKVWENLGFEVRPIDCTATYRQFGCLHCLVNILKRA